MKKVAEKDPKSSFSSSSSSDFEFTVSFSPRKTSTALCPADELFCNGRLLPLHHSRRVSSVRTLFSSSGSSSSGDSSGAISRDSTVSSDDDGFKRLQTPAKSSKQFSLSRFSSVFRKSPNINNNRDESRSRGKWIGSTAKEAIKKCLRKVQQRLGKSVPPATESGESKEAGRFSVSFSGNLSYPRGRSRFLPSCPSSSRSSPSRSGVLRRGGVKSMSSGSIAGGYGSAYCSDASSMEELHSAIQGAIAHCKNSLIQNKDAISEDSLS